MLMCVGVLSCSSERCEKRRGSERHRWYGVGICANKKSLARRATTDTTKIMKHNSEVPVMQEAIGTCDFGFNIYINDIYFIHFETVFKEKYLTCAYPIIILMTISI